MNCCFCFQSKGQKPMFVQLILENIWSVYEAIVIQRFVYLFDYKKNETILLL
jgi:hypothetical protein